MNFGYSDIQNIIYNNAIRMKYPNSSKFAKDTAKLIWTMIEEREGHDSMSKKDWNLFHGFPQELEPVVLQLRKGFNFEPKRDQIAIETYRWLQEQGKEKLAVFIRWATDKERVQYVGKYRNNPGMIKNDWKLAFDMNAPAIIRNDDGSLNV